MTRIARQGPLLGWSLLLAVLLTGCDRPEVMNPQFIRDKYLAITIYYGLADAAYLVLNGHPAGDVDVQAACDRGSFRITGNANVTANAQEYEFQYEIVDCFISEDLGFYSVSVTVSGTMTVTGSWDTDTWQGSEQMISESLHMDGESLYEGNHDGFDKKCRFEFISVTNATSDADLGEICDRPFSASWSHRG